MQNFKNVLLTLLLFLNIRNCFSQMPDTLRYVEQRFIGFSDKKTITVLPEDTTYFCIALKGNVTFVKFKGTWRQLDDNKQLSKFIRKNKALVDHNRVLIIAPSKGRYSDFKFIIDALKDNDLIKFHFVPSD